MTYFVSQPERSPRVFIRVSQGSQLWIPEDPQNTDYQAFLEWLAEGNTPEPWPPAE